MCGSDEWRQAIREVILPWALDGTDLGDDVLEVGPGYGASVPSSVAVPANASSANFVVNTSTVSSTTIGNITATYAGVNKSATLTVNAPAPATLSSLTLNPTTVVGGSSSVGTVTLNKATSTPLVVTLTSNKPAKAIVPGNVTVPAGASSVTFNIATASTNKKRHAGLTASYSGVTKTATLTIVRRYTQNLLWKPQPRPACVPGVAFLFSTSTWPKRGMMSRLAAAGFIDRLILKEIENSGFVKKL